MASARLSETQSWLSEGGTVAPRQKDSSSTSNSHQRSSWSDSPPSRTRNSLSPIQTSSNGQITSTPPLKSRHNSTSSSTTNSSSVMSISQQMGQEQAPFLPPLSGLSNGKSKPHTLPPLRFTSPSNAEDSNAIRRTTNENNGSAKWTPLNSLSHGSMYERMRG